MPRYELLMIARDLTKPNLQALLRRTANLVFEQDGIIRKIQNMGVQELPYRMKAHAEWHTHGHYFLFDVHLKTDSLLSLRKEFKFDSDIIRPSILKAHTEYDEIEKKTPKIYQCNISYQPSNRSRQLP